MHQVELPDLHLQDQPGQSPAKRQEVREPNVSPRRRDTRTAPEAQGDRQFGADGIALPNPAIQAVGCVAARIYNTNNCPAGIATQKPELRRRLDVAAGAQRLATFFAAATQLMQVMARACGHRHLSELRKADLTTWKREIMDLSGIPFGGLTTER